MGDSPIVVKAIPIQAPIEVYVRATVAASESIRLPDEFKRNHVSVQADGEDVYVRFGITAQTADDTAVSALGPPIVAAVNGTAKVANGTTERFDLEKMFGSEHADGGDIFMAHISPVGGQFMRFWRSSGRVVPT